MITRNRRQRQETAISESAEPSRPLSEGERSTGLPSPSPASYLPFLPTSNPKGWFWSDEQTLYFLEKLYEARRENKLDITNKASSHLFLFRSFLPGFRRRWPLDFWDAIVLRRKLNDLKAFWRVFRAVVFWSGDDYEEETGQALMSEENKEILRHLHPKEASRVIRKGLTIGDHVNWDTWEYIFSDDPPAGKYIRGPGDDAYWQREGREEADEEGGAAEEGYDAGDAAAEAPGSSDNEHGVFSHDSQSLSPESMRIRRNTTVRMSTESIRPSQRPRSTSQLSMSPPSMSLSSSGISQTSPPRRNTTPAVSRAHRPKRPANAGPLTSDLSPNDAPVPSRKRRRGGVILEELKEVMLSQGNRSYDITHRPEGAGDIERAIISYDETLGKGEIHRKLGVIQLFTTDPMTAIVWNALGEAEEREAFIEEQLQQRGKIRAARGLNDPPE